VENEEHAINQNTVIEDLKSIINLLIDKRMMYLAPEILWAGMSLAIFTGLLVLSISETIKGNDPNEKLMFSMLTMISLGFGEIIGSLSIGQVIDKAGNNMTSKITIGLIII